MSVSVSASAFAAPEPSQKDIDTAIALAKDVRDSNEDDKYLDIAAAFVVEEIDVRRNLEYLRYERTKGAKGVRKRTELEEIGEGDSSRVAVGIIPETVMNGVHARDEYIARVPFEKDKEKNADLYAFDNADVFFVYGHFTEARTRFDRIYAAHGLRDEQGQKAWEKLVSIATKSHDVERAEALAQDNPESDLSRGVLRSVAYTRADRAFEEKKWAEALRRYEDIVQGDPKPLEVAYGRLGAIYAMTFQYAKAASTYDAIVREARFEKSARKDAGRNAMVLYRALGLDEKTLAVHRIVRTLPLTPDERASTDFIAAGASHTLETFYAQHPGSPLAVEAAWTVASERTGTPRRQWLENTVAAWKRFKAGGNPDADKPPYVDHVAEAEFALIDEEIRTSFEGHLHYVTMSPATVMGQYAIDAKRANALDQRLARIAATYASPTIVASAIARRGSLYDTLRSALDECGGVRFKLFAPQQEQLLQRMRASGNPDLVDKADAIVDSVKTAWTATRSHQVDSNDALMKQHYLQADALAKTYNVTSPQVTLARNRLAYFTNGAFPRAGIVKVPAPGTFGTMSP